MLQLLLLAFSVSLDCFSVSIAQSISRKKFVQSILITSIFFGVFQALMPLIGWGLGMRFKILITGVDHWIAFILLLILGVKMIYKGFKKEIEVIKKNLGYGEVLLLAIATSIDALVIGITFAFIKTPIILAVLLFGIVTFMMSLIGSILGKKLRYFAGKNMEVVGGVILIFIGLKILITHLF